MIGLYRIAVLLMCACVVMSDVIDYDDGCEYNTELTDNDEPPCSADPADTIEPPCSAKPADTIEPPCSAEPANTDELTDTDEPACSANPADTIESPCSADPADTDEPPYSPEVAAKFAEFIADWKPTEIHNNDTANSPNRLSDSYLQSRLYESIYSHDFDRALDITKSIIQQDRYNIIKSTVDFMIREQKSQLTAYAYKLWEDKGGIAVEKLFPREFEMVFNDSLVTFTNYWYHVPIRLSKFEDLQDDKDVLADNENPYGKDYTWNLEPVTVDGKLYFKIRHYLDGRYMKLAKHRDRDGDHIAYASPESDTKRHYWMFQPVRHDGIILLLMINVEYYEALKLAQRAYGGSRRAFGIGGNFASDPARCGWRVRISLDGKFIIRRN